MRLFTLTISLMIFGCIKETTINQKSTPASTAANDAPYVWSIYKVPKVLQISDAFSDEEVQNIEEMADAWTESVEGKKTFFTFGSRVVEISNDIDLDNLLDSTLGIYKTDNWPSELPGSALAVTQIFGIRKNVGKENEYIDIQHADILLNEDNHNFDTEEDGPNYDLRTVILHEMGHFLGLQHKPLTSSKNSSIMYPSINSSENKRIPLSVDVLDISEKYQLSGSGSGAIQGLIAKDFEIDNRGIPVKIIIELHHDGRCIHKVDGVIYERHQLKK